MPYSDEDPVDGPFDTGLWWVLPALIAGGIVSILAGVIL